MTQQVGIGIVGYGAIARVHAAVLTIFSQIYPDMGVRPHIVAMTPGGDASVARALRDYPHVPHVSYNELLARNDVDVVLCATPTDQHAAQVEQALYAHKHVMCEKPLTVDVAQSKHLIEMARAHHRVLAVNHHFRHVPALREMQRQITDGVLGTPISAHLRYFRASNVNPNRPVTWRFLGAGGGVLVDLGSHLIDLVHYLFQSQIMRVHAELRTVVQARPNRMGELVQILSDDVAWITAHLANGMRVSLEASKMVPGAADDIRVEAYGTRASIMFDMLDVNSLMIGAAHAPAAAQRVQIWNQQQPAITLPSPETPTGLLSWHAASWQQCLARVAGQETALCDGDAGLLVDAVIAAAHHSAATQTWVEVMCE